MNARLAIFAIAIIFAVLFLFTGCTQNQRARRFGGIVKVNLPKGKKLVTATWKDNDLWYLLRSTRSGEKPDSLIFKEDSEYGLVQGDVIFYEH